MAGRTRTAKALAKRIDMEYFKRLHPFRRWRLILSIAAPVVVLVFIGSMTAAGSRAPYSSGPLSLAHQVFGQRCERCHATETQTFRAHVTDMTCVACHDAPAHKPNQPFTPACPTCHLDHRGAIALAAVDDHFCEQCHRDLKTSAGALTVAQTVGPFQNGHPEFAVRRPGAADRAVLRFNHAVHLKGDVRGPGGPTKLECATCHKPAAMIGDRPSARSRDLMAPVTYAAACASCHPLYFDPLIDAVAPHDTPDNVHAFVVQSLQRFIAGRPDQIGRVEPARGRIPVSFPTPMRPVRTAGAWTAERTAMAERLLWSKTCAECHTLESPAAALPRVVPTNIAKTWMPHARFDHRAHQLATCTSCHAASTSRDTSDVLMPSIATCQQCHKPSRGAEARCFECHAYHDWTKAKPAVAGFDLRQITN
ncbi:MAG TPA: hypothetical protein VGJ39_14680 [Vicinamibacterales bacterium]